jgi:general secretion pathway protein H
MGNPSVALTGLSVIATVPGRQQGFSLLELLVALVVVVLVTTMVNLTVSSGGQDIQLEAKVRNLADVASYALDEAQMTGIDYGLLLQENQEAGETTYSYSWLERHVEGWGDPVSGKDLFAPENLPPGIALELEVEDAPVAELSLDDNEEEKINPQVVFYASGETTVGAINVRQMDNGEVLWRIEWDLLGRFDVLRRGEAEEEY